MKTTSELRWCINMIINHPSSDVNKHFGLEVRQYGSGSVYLLTIVCPSAEIRHVWTTNIHIHVQITVSFTLLKLDRKYGTNHTNKTWWSSHVTSSFIFTFQLKTSGSPCFFFFLLKWKWWQLIQELEDHITSTWVASKLVLQQKQCCHNNSHNS